MKSRQYYFSRAKQTWQIEETGVSITSETLDERLKIGEKFVPYAQSSKPISLIFQLHAV